MGFFPINKFFYRIFFYNFLNYLLIYGEMMTIAKIVGENLKTARKAKGITQTQIAGELGTRQADYSDYETGKIQLDYEKIVYLCQRFDITPDDLFGLY